MSLWKRFKEELGKGYDQVNMLDGGKSYKTRTSSGPVGYDRIRDVFDANTASDYAKRNSANSQVQGFRPNMTYKQEQEELYGKSNVADNFGQSIVNPIARSVNTFGTNVVKLGAVPTIAVDLTQESIFGTDDSYQQKLNKANRFLDEWGLGKDNGLLHAGTHFQRTEELNDPKKMAGTILQTGADLGSFIPAGKAVGAGYTGTKALTSTLLRQGTENAVYNVMGNVGEQLNYTGKVDPKQVVVAGATGYVAPVPFYGAGKLAKGGRNQISKLISKSAQEATDTPIKVNVDELQPKKDINSFNDLYSKTDPIDNRLTEIGNELTKLGSNPKNKGRFQQLQKEANDLMAQKETIRNEFKQPLGGVAQQPTVQKLTPQEEINAINKKAKNEVLTNEELKVRSNLQAIKDSITVKPTDTKTVKVTNDNSQMSPNTVKVMNESSVPENFNPIENNVPKPNSTQSIGSAMPTIEQLKARQGASLTRVQAEEIAAKVGANVDDVERNIKRYGYEKTSSEYLPRADRVPYNPETGVGIENIDAVVSTELKNKYGKTVKVTNGSEFSGTPKASVMSPEEEASLFSTAPVQKLTPQEEINAINKKAMMRGDKLTITEENRIAELKKQITDEVTKTEPTVKIKKETSEPNPNMEEVVNKIANNEGTNLPNGSMIIKTVDNNGREVFTAIKEDGSYINTYTSKEASLFSTAPVKVTDTTTKFSGKQIAQEAKNLGSDQGGLSDYTLKNIAAEDYKIKTVSIDDLRKNDPSLDEYLTNSGNEVRDFEGEPFGMNPIVSSTGEVQDGWNRIHQALVDGKDTIDVLYGEPKQNTVKVEQPKAQPVVKVKQSITPKNERLKISQQLYAIAEEQKKFVPHSEPWEELQLRGEVLAKQLDEPLQTNKLVDNNGKLVDTTTGEILDTPKAPAKNLDDFVKNLPDSKAVTREEADALIVEGTDWLRRGAQAIDDVLRAEGDSYENFSRAIHQANIDGVEPPAKYAQYYDEFVKPALDKYRDASGRVVGENIGDVGRYYLPRMRITDAGQVVFDDTTLINSIDNKVFGSGMSRRTDEFQLGVDDIDHTPEGLSRYATQALSERYRDAKAIGKVIDQAKARGVELDVPQARTVVDMENELSQKISDAARKGGVFSSGTEKLDLVDEIGSIGTAKGKEKFVLDKGLAWANRQISDSNELYSTPYGGSGKSIGETMGFYRYTEAEGKGVTINNIINKYKLNPEEYLNDYYNDIAIDPEVKNNIIANTKKRIDYINNNLASRVDKDGNLKYTPEQLEVKRQQTYTNTEKSIARQQLVEFLENTEIQSKQIKKNINQDARRMLVMDASNRSLAEKTVSGIVGLKYLGLLGYSFRTALFNLTESRRVFAKYGAKDFAHAVAMAFKDPDFARRMGVHETRVSDVLNVQNKNINPKWWKPMGLFELSERWKDNVLLHAADRHYRQQGLDNMELFDAIYKDFNKYGIKYGQAGTLGFNKSKTGRLTGQFLQFTIKDWKIRINEALKAMGGKGATEAEKKAAQAYLAREIPTTLATYLVMSAAIGISWQEVAGLINPMQSSPVEKDAPTDVKVVNNLPGGPFIQDMKDLYIATRMAFEDAEEGESPELGNVYKNQLIKDALTYVPGGQQIANRTGEFINDQRRGYDENSKGRARYEAADNPIDIAKGLIFGGYTTNNAREYYGRTGVAGDLPGMGGEQKRPVSQQYQNLIDQGADAGDIIQKSRAKQDRDAAFYNTPQGKAWKELYSTTFNPDTGKYESDVISPEKWKGVQADKSSTTYTQLKEAAQQRSRDFGDPVDPLFTDKWSKYKNEIMTMRSQYTGDDKEMKDIANATTQWYKDYMKDYIAYINQIKNREYEESDQYGVSPRVKDYWELTTKNPAIPENTARDYPIISRYYDIKNNQGEETAKEFFKANADELSAAFDAQTKAKFEWTNQMRALEGAQPLAWDVFQNITFGYEADEESVYKQLGYKLGKFGGSGGSSSSKGLREADFGRAKAAPEPTIKVKVSKVKSTAKPVKKITIKRTGKRI